MAFPVWNVGITPHEILSIERIQKTALAIILGGSYTTYIFGPSIIANRYTRVKEN